MPAMRQASAAGSALCVQVVKITAASKRAERRRSTSSLSLPPSPAPTASPSPFTHGAAKTIAPSTSTRNGTAAAPEGDASSVICASGRPARSAPIAGVVMSTSPRLSRRTASSLRTRRQASARAGSATMSTARSGTLKTPPRSARAKG
jgi:hypothetical protein